MPIQDYKIYTGNAYKGQISDASTPRVVISGKAEVEVGFGKSLLRGTNEGQVVPGHDTGNVYGIAIREANHEAKFRPSTGETVYPIGQSVSVMQEGFINVLVTLRAAVAGVKANIVDATGEFSGGVPAVGETASLNVTFMENGLVGDVVKARIDIV